MFFASVEISYQKSQKIGESILTSTIRRQQFKVPCREVGSRAGGGLAVAAGSRATAPPSDLSPDLFSFVRLSPTVNDAEKVRARSLKAILDKPAPDDLSPSSKANDRKRFMTCSLGDKTHWFVQVVFGCISADPCD